MFYGVVDSESYRQILQTLLRSAGNAQAFSDRFTGRFFRCCFNRFPQTRALEVMCQIVLGRAPQDTGGDEGLVKPPTCRPCVNICFEDAHGTVGPERRHCAHDISPINSVEVGGYRRYVVPEPLCEEDMQSIAM